MKTGTLGNPAVLQKPYTRFYIHYLDLNRMEEMLYENGITYFAMETPMQQITWVLHIPDEHREAFDVLVVRHNFNLSAMNQPFWYQDRERDAVIMGGTTKTAKRAILVVLTILLILYIIGMVL